MTAKVDGCCLNEGIQGIRYMRDARMPCNIVFKEWTEQCVPDARGVGTKERGEKELVAGSTTLHPVEIKMWQPSIVNQPGRFRFVDDPASDGVCRRDMQTCAQVGSGRGGLTDLWEHRV